jgi:hypothetical protein
MNKFLRLSIPAVTVVIPTKSIGRMVTQAYFTLPLFIMKEVPTASASVASSWLAVPNIGQIVATLPV